MSKQSLFTFTLASATVAMAGLIAPIQAQADSAVMLIGSTITAQAKEQTGRQSATAPCNDSESREWSELLANRVKKELYTVFSEEMKLVTASTKHQTQTVQVRAELEDIDLQVCNFGGGAWTGQMNLRVTWESSVSNTSKASHRVTTTGSYAQAAPISTTGSHAMKEALRMAIRKLTIDEGFAALNGQPKTTDLALVN
jgi:alpha-galactosidase